jgi:hypothetical protein
VELLILAFSSVLFLALSTSCAFKCSLCHNGNWNIQAPVSDREYRATLPETAAMIDLASTLISEGRGSELLPREADSTSPITASRLVYDHIVAVQANKIQLELVIVS